MHLIGESFTRLTPAIDFSGVDFTSNAAVTCGVGEVPAALAAVHVPTLVNAWQQRLVGVLVNPTQTENRRGKRRVQILGTGVWEFDTTGAVSAYVWIFNDRDCLELERMTDGTVGVQDVPHQSLWANGFRTAALRILNAHHPEKTELCLAYANWVHSELLSRHWTVMVQDAVREKIALDVGLDSVLLDIAGQIQLTSLPKVPVRLDAYNHVIQHQAAYQTLRKEAPQLIVLYALLADTLSGQGQATEQMRSFLFANRIKPAFWRLLCRQGTQWIKEFLPYFRSVQDEPSKVAVDLLTLAQSFGTAQLVAPWMLQAFIQLGGSPNAGQDDYTGRLDDLFGLCARLGLLEARAVETTRDLLKDRIHDIMSWASSYLVRISAQSLRRMSLKRLLRLVDEQLLLEYMQHHASKRWELDYNLDSGDDGVQVVVLDSPLAVWSEARAMRHCAADYIDSCADGRCLMVSLRPCSGGKALATVAFDLEGEQVRLKKISGFANTLVPANVLALARHCARQLQGQRRTLPGKPGALRFKKKRILIASVPGNKRESQPN